MEKKEKIRKLPTKKKKSKKKKKKEKSVSILQEIDKSMNVTYGNIIEEVEYYQMLVEEADRKAERNARKALRKKNQLYSSDYKKKGRLRVIEEIEGRGFLDRIQDSLKDVSQIIIRCWYYFSRWLCNRYLVQSGRRINWQLDCSIILYAICSSRKIWRAC